MYLKRF